MSAPRSGDAPRWRLYPPLLLRRAGFDTGLLERLADPEVLQAAAEHQRRLHEREEQRSRLLQEEIPKAVARASAEGDRNALRALSGLRSRVGRRRPAGDAARHGELAGPVAGYAAALDAEHAAFERLRSAVEAESSARGARLAGVLAEPRVQDALVQLAPSFFAHTRRWLARPERAGASTAKERGFARRAYLYCQRLAAKNETTSFFGPLVHGRVEPGATGIGFGAETDAGFTAAEAFVAFWAVSALARAMAADHRVTDRVPVTLVPACRLEPAGLVLPAGRRIPLAGAHRRLAGAIDGVRGTPELAEAAGLDPAAARRLLARLARAGAVRTWPEPPSTAPRPLDVLIEDARALAAGTEWPDRLRDLRDLAAGYADADGADRRLAALERVERAFVELTDTEPRRAGGQMYADRTVVSLDTRGDQTPVLVGGDVAGRWEQQLGPVLDLAGHYGALRRQACLDLCAAVLREAGTDRLPYDALIPRMQDPEQLARFAGPAQELAGELAELVERRRDGVQATLDPEELRRLVPDTGEPCFASPDLMLERRPGGPDLLVLGELHPYVFAWGSQGLFSDDPDRLRAAFTADLSPWGGAARLATVVRRRRHKGLVAEWFPGRFVEVTAVAARDRRRTSPITDLVVRLVDGTPRLSGPDGDLVLYAGEDDHPHLRAFAAPAAVLPPVRAGGSVSLVVPRIVVGDVLVQRARWRIDAAELAPPGSPPAAETFRAAQEVRARHGVPRHVFAHVPGEPKPICVDLGVPVAVETLAALAGRAGGAVELVEMRPAPDALWLHRRGGPTTSEFRLALRRVP
ncbi:lantibiotic dehydratase [Actinomadura craniellae]|uniref:Lantibiotic dehydratase n=1 Tax=Actinomadura craniellae TaxID=2231787 RepID=A0A365HAM2_9ACTN|nr:lantibiotic dehydratase [Actinomadura craniellae]RAY16145.1 lantibiotic dehydratase [Actinomadura craniellae]